MKINLITCLGFFFFLIPLQAQIPEAGYFKFLTESYDNHNSDITEYLISECNFYLNNFSDSPNIAETYFILGKLYEEEKDYPEAFTCYLKINCLDPSGNRQSDAISHINRILQDKAERTFRDKRTRIDEFVGKPTQFSDRNTAFHEYLLFLYDLDIEDINEILENEIKYYLNVYAQVVKNLDQILFWQAELYEKSKDWEEAVAAYTKLKYITPDSPLLAQSMFKIAYLQYNETRQYQEAKENFSDILTNYAGSSIAGDAQFYLAEMYQEKFDDPVESIANYRLLVENYPKHRYAVESLKRVAEMLKNDDKYEEAINAYYQIFELYPEHTSAPDALLQIEELYRRKLNNYIKAIETLKLYALQYATREDAAERLFDAADLYQDELNDNQAAIETYNEVINKFPESKYAERAKDRIADLNE